MASLMGDDLFELDRVVLWRGGKPVLRELSAKIPKGASCVVGPSGSGKSTLLRLLDRLTDPTGGSVRYRDRDVRDHDVLALRRDVCLVPQLPALLDGTVGENVLYGARLAGRDADVQHALRLAGLDASFLDRDVTKLSVGEQQRTMLARALALEPSVLLLDEPTSALDGATKQAVERTLLELRSKLGMSYVLVTHDPAQAERMADWSLELPTGHIAGARAAGQPA